MRMRITNGDIATEFVFELGYRFPDMTDEGVLLAYDEWRCRQDTTSPTSLRGRAVLLCYERGANAWYKEIKR